MKLFEKIKNKFKKKTTTVIYETGSAPASYPEWDYEKFAKETYLKNVISFRCIDLIAKSAGSVKWKLMREMDDGELEEVVGHPVNKLLKRVNPESSWSTFIYEAVAYLPLSGNTFLQKIGPETGPNKGLPFELYVLRPDKMKINLDPKTGRKISYEYNPNNNPQIFEIDPITGESQIKQIKFFNPLDENWGTSITQPAAREIDTSNAGSNWNKSLLENQARPGMLYISEQILSQQQRDSLKAQIRETREGGVNAGRSLILEGLAKAQPYGFTPTDMDFIEGGREIARKIASAYGVPAQMLGIKGDQTFSNFEQAREMFWEDTVIYYLNLIKEELNYWMFGIDSDLSIQYIIDDVPAFDKKEERKWERLQNSDYLTMNEKRTAVGLDESEGADDILVPANMIPIKSVSMFETETDEGGGDTENQEEEEKRIQQLMNNGLNRNEALELLGLPPDDGEKNVN